MRINQIATNQKANNARPNFGLKIQASHEFKDFIGHIYHDGWSQKDITDSFEKLEKDVDKNLSITFDKSKYVDGQFTYNLTVTDGKFKEKIALPCAIGNKITFDLLNAFLSKVRQADENIKLSNAPIKEQLDKIFYQIALDDVGP